MKATYYLLIFCLVVLSCEKEHDNEQIEEREFAPGEINVGFKENTSLKTAFNLVNSFGLEITEVWGHHYVSDLPNDSIDYVVNILKTKTYLNNDIWKVVKNGNVYNHYSTGKITVLCTMVNMNLLNQQDWFNTAKELKLLEQSSIKVFYLKVPVGKEIGWRNRFRMQSIVRWAELNYLDEIVPT